MFSYELAKRLKEAGFPQHNPDEFGAQYLFKTGDSPLPDNRAYLPSLSELIEWCGEKFGGLYKNSKNEWVAYDKPKIPNLPTNIPKTGSTPEEAVAELGIALHTNV